jgi:hypothetical protein
MFTYYTEDGTLLYMGRDKHENEPLIEHAWPEDIWFHVDNLSSAHVYARLLPPPVGDMPSFRAATLDDVSPALLADAGQLVKANSIEGCKKASVTIVYTPASNLKKDGSMAIGQVGFKNEKLVRRAHVGERDKDVLSRLAKTMTESSPDFREASACSGSAHARTLAREPEPSALAIPHRTNRKKRRETQKKSQ